MISFLLPKIKKNLILFAVTRTADHFSFHCESIDNCLEDMAKKGEVSTKRG